MLTFINLKLYKGQQKKIKLLVIYFAKLKRRLKYG